MLFEEVQMRTRRDFVGFTGAAAIAAAAPSLMNAAPPPATKGKEKPRIESIAAAGAPKAIGPYSQAIRAGGMLYLSGQIGLDPTTGNMVEGDFSAQARRVFENLKAVLLDAKAGFGNVVKTTVYLTDLANFPTLNTIYGEFFGENKPARATVGVAALPRGAMVEIDLIAIA